MIVFETTHLSLYAIAYDVSGNVIPSEPNQSDDGGIPPIVMMAIGVMIGICVGAAVMFLIKRNRLS